jgi:ABC-type transport system involved in multi-copper enzyme maturation permease subunit
MVTIRLVAGAVFKESVRDRVPYSMVVFAALLMAASFLISQLTAGQDLKIIKDLGLAALSIFIFGLVIAVFIGIGLVSKEVERRSIFALLAKPLSREQFILGKYAGLALTLIVNLSVMTLAYYAVLLYYYAGTPPGVRASWPAPAMDPRLLVAIVLIVAELMLVTAIALFFSTFSSPLLSALLTLACWVAGHFNADLRHFEAVVDSAPAAYLARALYYLLPNLAPFNVRAEVVYGMPVAWSHVAFTLLYAAVYIGMLLAASMAIFRRRDFK